MSTAVRGRAASENALVSAAADFIAWYTQGEGAPSSVADMLEDVLSGLFFTDRASDTEDFLGLAVEQA